MATGDINGLRELRAALAGLRRKSAAAAARALERCALVAVREAKANAPRSPAMKQVSATLKRKRRTARRTFPGGLEKSIAWEMVGTAGEPGASVFVAANSYAGKYARRIHDEKWRTWRNRGPGTVAKGDRADERFIERAVRDNAGAFARIIADEAGKVEA